MEVTLALKNLDCALSQPPSFSSTVHSFLTVGSFDFFRSFLSIGLCKLQSHLEPSALASQSRLACSHALIPAQTLLKPRSPSVHDVLHDVKCPATLLAICLATHVTISRTRRGRT